MTEEKFLCVGGPLDGEWHSFEHGFPEAQDPTTSAIVVYGPMKVDDASIFAPMDWPVDRILARLDEVKTSRDN